MASTTLNLTESFPLSDTLVESVSPTRHTVNIEDSFVLSDTADDIHTIRTLNIEDSLSLKDTFDKTQTIRYVVNVEDGLAVGDEILVTDQNVFIFNFEENITLGEEFSESHTLRTIRSIPDTVLLSDSITITVNDRIDVDLIESIGLDDSITVKGTDRSERSILDALLITDSLLQEYGIRMDPNQGGEGFVNGLSFASLLAGAVANLTVTIPFNNIFYKWIFLKSGIDNIYKPETTLTVPAGGGVIKPSFVDLGAIEIPVGTIVTVVDPNDLEYIDDVSGDFISTTENVESAGDAVSVAIKNLTIEQGSTFFNIVIYRDVNGDPVNLTGYTAEMQIRKTKESSTILLTLDTSNGYLALGGAAGTVTINVPANITDALDFIWGRYDLELYPAGNTDDAIRLLEGKINLSKQVTQ